MTRIIAGTAGGRRIATPAGSGTRPTSDRVREAIFSRLEHLDVLAGAHVLDLYAGSGALGLEAASRGAAEVLLVEQDRGAAEVIRRNAADLRLPGVTVRRDTVARVTGAPCPGPRRDLVLVDPPYDLGDEALGAVLAALATGDWLAPGAVLVVERSSRSGPPTWPPALTPVGDKRYGETTVWYARHDPAADG
ncbi:16S rRNA (guanine(966)-N(2))-methyltransferase RsmD [Arsenicicoccus sp. oral taxon 190]|uniref:16S rRNA (guanine(966)-N(2))-methyltransferase RsmD n=1 Tax=Arsenicicoccus sp. oral taxon 190 TaxID=1658671 RepID=UPI00067A16CA|nr:16S rRNA (guanine(966)-N(2))-methyltransferase RsmD [Arsenicicoccus sp. oral taxon 190]AKT52266.1 methyltransferase [Arsenicicoccus sp. oral taxon 190]